jgi:hypothetical protein
MLIFAIVLLLQGAARADKEYTNIELTGDTVPHDEYEARDSKSFVV